MYMCFSNCFIKVNYSIKNIITQIGEIIRSFSKSTLRTSWSQTKQIDYCLINYKYHRINKYEFACSIIWWCAQQLNELIQNGFSPTPTPIMQGKFDLEIRLNKRINYFSSTRLKTSNWQTNPLVENYAIKNDIGLIQIKGRVLNMCTFLFIFLLRVW